MGTLLSLLLLLVVAIYACGRTLLGSGGFTDDGAGGGSRRDAHSGSPQDARPDLPLLPYSDVRMDTRVDSTLDTRPSGAIHWWRAPKKFPSGGTWLNVDTDNAGNAHLVWSGFDQTLGMGVLRGSHYAFQANGWSAGNIFAQDTYGPWDLTVRGDGFGATVWRSSTKGALWLTTAAPASRSWSTTPKQLGQANSLRSMHVVSLAGGHAMVTWMDERTVSPDGDRLYALLLKGGVTAGPLWTLDSGARLRHLRQRIYLAADGKGNAFLTWKVTSKVAPYTSLVAARFNGAVGKWEVPVDLGGATYGLTNYQLNVSENGEAVVVKMEQSSSCCSVRYYQPATGKWTRIASVPMGTVWPNDIPSGFIRIRSKGVLLMLRREDEPSRLWFTRGTVGSTSWSKPLLLHQTKSVPGMVGIGIENLILDNDASGNLFATWGVRSADSRTDTIYCRRFDSILGTWEATTMIESAAYYQQPQVLSVASGGTAVMAYLVRGSYVHARVFR